MNINNQMIIHIAAEVAVIGAVFFWNKRRIDALEERIKKMEELLSRQNQILEYHNSIIQGGTSHRKRSNLDIGSSRREEPRPEKSHKTEPKEKPAPEPEEDMDKIINEEESNLENKESNNKKNDGYV